METPVTLLNLIFARYAYDRWLKTIQCIRSEYEQFNEILRISRPKKTLSSLMIKHLKNKGKSQINIRMMIEHVVIPNSDDHTVDVLIFLRNVQTLLHASTVPEADRRCTQIVQETLSWTKYLIDDVVWLSPHSRSLGLSVRVDNKL